MSSPMPTPTPMMPPEFPPGAKIAVVTLRCPQCTKFVTMGVVVGVEKILALPTLYCYHESLNPEMREPPTMHLMRVTEVPALEDPPRVTLAG